jgi:hypothetical protein
MHGEALEAVCGFRSQSERAIGWQFTFLNLCRYRRSCSRDFFKMVPGSDTVWMDNIVSIKSMGGQFAYRLLHETTDYGLRL